MTVQPSLVFSAATDVGRVREHNEDNFLVDRRLGLCIVADGMGGHAAGEVASAMAVRVIHEEIKRHRPVLDAFASAPGAPDAARRVLALVDRAVQSASARIYQQARVDSAKRGMGTTCSLALIVANTCFVGHVGDSRVYLARGGKLQQVTEDHTVFHELMRRGKLAREQIERLAQRNAITRAVGVYERVEVDTIAVEIVPGDAFLLCSDGLHGYVAADRDLLDPIAREGEGAARALVDFANDRGGRDNVTAVIARVGAMGADDAARVKRQALKREVLSQMPLFSRLADRELLRVMSVASVRSYRPGQVVIREGETGDELFIVLSGQLRVTAGETTLSTLGPGDHVGEMALVRNGPRSATVTSEFLSELIVVRRADFLEILRKEHELAVKLLWQFLGVIADRLEQTSKSLRSARAELAIEDLSEDALLELDLDEALSPGATGDEAGDGDGRGGRG